MSTNATLRLGLIGFGAIAQAVHLPILLTFRDVAVVAIAETDAERREQARRRVPAACFFPDYQAVLQLPDLDGVVICVPPALHAKAAIAAMEQRKHVYLEKPMALNMEEGRAVLDVWRDSGVVGAIGFNYRFSAINQAVREYVQSGALGKVLYARTVFSGRGLALSDWRRLESQGGGVLLDLASHHVDLVRFLFKQEIAEVSAQTLSVQSETDNATVEMKLEDGARVQSYFSSSSIEEDCIEVYGTDGKIAADRYLSDRIAITRSTRDFARFARLSHDIHAFVRTPYIRNKLYGPTPDPSYRKALEHFVAAALGGHRASPDFEDGYASLRVIGAAKESARTGRVIPLSKSNVEPR